MLPLADLGAEGLVHPSKIRRPSLYANLQLIPSLSERLLGPPPPPREGMGKHGGGGKDNETRKHLGAHGQRIDGRDEEVLAARDGEQHSEPARASTPEPRARHHRAQDGGHEGGALRALQGKGDTDRRRDREHRQPVAESGRKQ